MLKVESERELVEIGSRDELWAAASAVLGAAVWAGMAVLARSGVARIGSIELLFLFAPLVIVPLGMELGRLLVLGSWALRLAQKIQPLGAALAVAAVWIPPGRAAALAALGWLVVCGLVAGDGALRLISLLWKDPGEGARAKRNVAATFAIAQIDLAVGGAWFVASRLGMKPMGIQEPIGLLTAVHFHFAGFATATIAAATLCFAERRRMRRWLRRLVRVVIALPFVVAAGFVISPALKMGAALVFSMSVAALAVSIDAISRDAEDGTARGLLRIAAGAVFAAMILSGAYAVADFAGSDALTIPQMARTHGILNGFGFCLMGLLGWLVEFNSALRDEPT